MVKNIIFHLNLDNMYSNVTSLLQAICRAYCGHPRCRADTPVDTPARPLAWPPHPRPARRAPPSTPPYQAIPSLRLVQVTTVT